MVGDPAVIIPLLREARTAESGFWKKITPQRGTFRAWGVIMDYFYKNLALILCLWTPLF